MKVTKGVIWALAGVLTLGAVLGGGPVWTAALAHAGEEPPPAPFRRCRGRGCRSSWPWPGWADLG